MITLVNWYGLSFEDNLNYPRCWIEFHINCNLEKKKNFEALNQCLWLSNWDNLYQILWSCLKTMVGDFHHGAVMFMYIRVIFMCICFAHSCWGPPGASLIMGHEGGLKDPLTMDLDIKNGVKLMPQTPWPTSLMALSWRKKLILHPTVLSTWWVQTQGYRHTVTIKGCPPCVNSSNGS